MRRYLVFAGMAYYPDGGWDDFKESFDTLSDCMDYLITHHCDWAHIVDSHTGQMVKRYIPPNDGQDS